MGKVEEGLRIYPDGVFSITDIGRDLEESDLVGTGLTSDEIHDNYYLNLTGDNSLVSDSKVDVIMCFEEYLNEDFATCIVLTCLLKLKGTEKHLIIWRNMDVEFTDEYGGYTMADEIDGGIYLVNPDKYLELSRKKAERERVFKERQAIKENEEAVWSAIYKEQREKEAEARYEKEKRETEESYNKLSVDTKKFITILRSCPKGLLNSQEYHKLMLAISNKVGYVEDIQLVEENNAWLTIKITHPRGFNNNKTRTSSILDIHKNTLKINIQKGLLKGIYAIESYRTILDYLVDQKIELLTPAECKARYVKGRMEFLSKLMGTLN